MAILATTKDYKIIANIAQRAVRGLGVDYMTTFMDIENTHINNTPLHLRSLLESEEDDFNHDILGIAKNMNRETKEIENCFLPRHSA